MGPGKTPTEITATIQHKNGAWAFLGVNLTELFVPVNVPC